MEKIDKLVDVLAKFGEALGSVKDLIADIQNEVDKHTSSLKQELMLLKKNNNGIKNSMSDISMNSFSTSEEVDQSDSGISSNKTSSVQKQNYAQTNNKVIPVSPYNIESKENNDQNVPLAEQWWNDDHVDNENCEIDWKKEYIERDELRLCLMVKEGWKKQNSSEEELEKILKTWTGRLMKWTVMKKGKAKNGKALLNVNFQNEEDRHKVFCMRKEIAEEGYLSVGEALTFVERKERWKMLMMAQKLNLLGKSVEFENKKICVDGQWWKYCLNDGWKKI